MRSKSGGAREALLEGVEELHTEGDLGAFFLLGDAVPVLTGRAGERHVAVLAAVEPGRGRALFAGSVCLFDGEREGQEGALLENSLGWLRRGEALGEAVLLQWDSLEGALTEKGAKVRCVDEYEEGLWGERSKTKLVLVGEVELEAPALESLRAFVERGGALLFAWKGWSHPHYGRKEGGFRVPDPCSALGAPWGVLATAVEPGGHEENVYQVAASKPALCHAGQLAEELRAALAGEREAESLEEEIDGEDAFEQRRFQVSNALKDAHRAGSVEALRPLLDAALARFEEEQGSLCPTKENPLGEEQRFERLVVYLVAEAWRVAPPEEVPAAPTAEDFPGAVDASAEEVERTVRVPLATERWVSTGLYARPGVPVEVQLSKEARGKGLRVRVGCHTDELYSDKEVAGGCNDDQGYGADEDTEWVRWPDLSFAWDLREKRTRVCNPHGGLVFLEVPAPPEGETPEPVEVTVRGAVAAPFFELGVHSKREWLAGLRDAPGPWAELACEEFILMVPSEEVRALEDPEGLLRVWRRVLQCYPELDGRPPHPRPERLCHDRQLSGGLLHSGYPIQSYHRWEDEEPSLSQGTLEVRRLVKDGLWGQWHELGHNRQREEWTFDGTTEVTCNLYTLYVFEVVCGIAAWESSFLTEPKAHAKEHFAKSHKWEALKEDPGLFLLMYAQIVREFGWEPYRALFAQYAALPQEELPQGDDAVREQWYLRLGRLLELDLGPWCRQWGVPLGKDARKELSAFAAWEPLAV